MNAQIKPFAVLHEVRQIPYWEVDSVWKQAAPLIQKGLDTQDELTLESVYNTLKNPVGNMQLWLIPNSFACVTQIIDRPTGIRKCMIVVGGGSGIENILAEIHKLEDWAKRYWNCKKTIIYGREGWLKLPGYKKVAVILEKDLWA